MRSFRRPGISIRNGNALVFVFAAIVCCLTATQVEAQPPLPPWSPDTLYAITSNPNPDPSTSCTLITIGANGVGTAVGSGQILPPIQRPLGLARYPDGRFFTYDSAVDRLLELDLATGNVVNASGIDLGLKLNGEGDITFDSNGVGYIAATNGSSNRLFRFSLAPNSGQPIAILPGNKQMDGLAAFASGKLWGLHQGGQQLFQLDLNPNPLQITQVVSFSGLPSSFQFGGLALHSTGMYGALAFSTGASSLYTIDPSTSAATKIGNIGFNEVCGLAFLPAIPPPLPPQLPPPPPRPPGNVAAVIVNQPVLGINLVAGSAAKTYTVFLNRDPSPSTSVTVNLMPALGVYVSPTSLTFTAANQPQSVTVSVPPSSGYSVPYSRIISHSITTTDPIYNNVAIASVPVKITSAEAGLASGTAPPTLPAFAGEGGVFFRGGQATSSNPVFSGPFPNPAGSGFFVQNVAHRRGTEAEAASPVENSLAWAFAAAVVGVTTIVGSSVLIRRFSS